MSEQAAPPYALLAELTHRCPLHCVYCSNPIRLVRESAELTTSLWRRIIAESAALGVVQVHLSGGEPLLRSDLEQIAAFAAEHGLYVQLSTSGVGLDAVRARRLADCGIACIQLSVQAASPRDGDRIAGRRAHTQKESAAAAVVEAGLLLTLNVVIHRLNIDSVPNILELGAAWGAERLELANAQYYNWALVNRPALLPSVDQVERARLAVNQWRRTHERGAQVVWVAADYVDGRPKPCMGGWGRISMTISPDGRALPCPAADTIRTLTFDSVLEHSLRWLWEESSAFAAFRGLQWMREPCRSCDRHTLDFGGCRCQTYQLTGDARKADPVCALSPDHAVVLRAREEATASAQRLVHRGDATRTEDFAVATLDELLPTPKRAGSPVGRRMAGSVAGPANRWRSVATWLERPSNARIDVNVSKHQEGRDMNQLTPGNTLSPGQQLDSPSGNASLIMQEDGNLVLYRTDDGVALWDTGGHAGSQGATMGADGNLTCIADDGVYFSTGSGGNAGAFLVLEDSGLVGLALQESWVWLAGTDISRVGAQYGLGFLNLYITQIRSAGSDTDHFTQSLKLLDAGGNVITDFGSITWEMGDVTAGYSASPPNTFFFTVDVPPGDVSLSWAWTVVNAGGGNANQVRQWGDQAADGLAKNLVVQGLTNLAGGDIWLGLGEIAAAGVVEGLKELWDLAFADCDGPVAVDALLLDRQAINRARLVPVNPMSRQYPGKPSPAGCGANSQYELEFNVVVA